MLQHVVVQVVNMKSTLLTASYLCKKQICSLRIHDLHSTNCIIFAFMMIFL